MFHFRSCRFPRRQTRPLSLSLEISCSKALNEFSLKNPDLFWTEAAKSVTWSKPYTQVFDGSNAPFNRWFVGGELNSCYNALDRHVEAGKGGKEAMIYHNPHLQRTASFTYEQLRDDVAKVAGLLSSLGVGKGDTVVIYLPMIPEAPIAMLACARLGAIHSVVFGGFAPAELSVRIKDCKPKVILTSSLGFDGQKIIEYKPLVDEALTLASSTHTVNNVVVLLRPEKGCQMTPGRDLDWAEAVGNATPFLDCVPVKSEDPLYILYTSGTTGAPKGILRDNGGHAVALNWAMKNIFDISSDDVWWAASDIGWVVGHSFCVYAPLFSGCTTIIYEGKPVYPRTVGPPDASSFWKVIQQFKVSGLFTAPTAIRAIKREDPNGNLPNKYDLRSLRTLFLAGERADPDTIKWAERNLKIPVIDNWWQTETGWPICANQVGVEGVLPVKYGSAFRPCPGYDLRVIDDNHNPVPNGTMGQLVIKLPLPPGTLMTLYNNDQRFVDAYMKSVPGYYDTGDAGLIDSDGYVHVLARIDDVINVAGHRLSSGGMEEILSSHPDIAEAVVIGIHHELKGHLPLGLAILNQGCHRSHAEIQQEVVKMVRERIGAVACFKRLIVVQRFPKTRSGKITRNILRKIAEGLEYTVPATIEDATVIDEMKEILKKEELELA